MPVDLNAIPPLAPLIRRPQTKRWLIFFGDILLAESASTLWCRESEHAGFDEWVAGVTSGDHADKNQHALT